MPDDPWILDGAIPSLAEFTVEVEAWESPFVDARFKAPIGMARTVAAPEAGPDLERRIAGGMLRPPPWIDDPHEQITVVTPVLVTALGECLIAPAGLSEPPTQISRPAQSRHDTVPEPSRNSRKR